MTVTEARKILGLGEDQDPEPHLENFEGVRERMLEMVNNAPNSVLQERYQEGLEEFDHALAAIREYLESWSQVEDSLRPEPGSDGEADSESKNEFENANGEVEVDQGGEKVGKPIFITENLVKDLSVLPVLPALDIRKKGNDRKRRDQELGLSTGACFVLLLIIMLCSIGAWYLYQQDEQRKLAEQERIALLDEEGAMLIESSMWQEAMVVYDELEKLDAGSEIIKAGRRRIEAGIIEEQNQFVAYWMGEIRLALDQGRWDDAEKAGNEILSKYPKEEETKVLLTSVSKKKKEQEKQANLEVVRLMMEERKLNEALDFMSQLTSEYEGDSKVKEQMELLLAAKQKADADRAMARELLEKAKTRDRGEYDADALGWLREAVSLAPDDKEILQYHDKLASYIRTVMVPRDYATVKEALRMARNRDRIVIAQGVWEGSLEVDKTVSLEGVAGKTILQCEANAGCVIALQKGLQDVRMSGLSLQHTTLDPAAERFPLVHVAGSSAEIADCRFEKGNGHGLSVIDGGHVKVVRSHFSQNAWNGIAVMGNGSLLEAENNVLSDNYHNGIEAWDGGAMILKSNICRGNSRNGIHIDIGAASATILGNVLRQNLEYGLVLSSAGSGTVESNEMKMNELGGAVIRLAGKEVEWKKNVISENVGVGFAIEYGLLGSDYENNQLEKNRGGNVVKSAVFEEE